MINSQLRFLYRVALKDKDKLVGISKGITVFGHSCYCLNFTSRKRSPYMIYLDAPYSIYLSDG